MKKIKNKPCGECGCAHNHAHNNDSEHDRGDESSCGCGHDHGHKSNIKVRIVRLVLGIIMLATGLITDFVPLFTAAYIVFGYDVIAVSVKNILKGRIFDENFLMTIATLGAFAIGEYAEGAAVMLFYQIGETLNDIAVSKTRGSISRLMDIRPDSAFVLRGGETIRVMPEDVGVGETVVVRAGERIPVDGTVTDGGAYIDKSALTGEAVPVRVQKDAAVESGCINKDGTLYIRADKRYEDSTASRILRLVDNAQKSRSERFITRFAKIYTPVVVILAAVVAVVPPLVTGGSFSAWLYRALIFLVVSCPCALVVSVPLTFFAGIGSASRIGVLIKGSDVLESLGTVKTVIFDKTGTLTKGVFDVTEVVGADTLRLCAYAEYYSNHPVSTAVRRAYTKDIDASLICGYTELAGMGIRAEIDGDEVLCGNGALMKKYNIDFSYAEKSGTVIYAAKNGAYIGYIRVSDVIKEGAAEAVHALGTLGIETAVLTGDNRAAAEYTAQRIGIQNVYADLMPEDKVRKCRELSELGTTAFVGDGINDAPVLACADVGFAMGALGSDAAIEAADAVIMNDEPKKVLSAVRIARRTTRIARQNIIIAVGIKIGVMVLGTVGLANMWTAVFADVGVTLVAVCNALRAAAVTKNKRG